MIWGGCNNEAGEWHADAVKLLFYVLSCVEFWRGKICNPLISKCTAPIITLQTCNEEILALFSRNASGIRVASMCMFCTLDTNHSKPPPGMPVGCHYANHSKLPPGMCAGDGSKPARRRCRGAKGTWCSSFIRQQTVPSKPVPRGNKACPGDCSGVGNCNYDIGKCECPAGGCWGT